MGARFGARRSFRHNLHDRWGGRFDAHASRMDAIHSLEVRLRVSVEVEDDPPRSLDPKRLRERHSPQDSLSRCMARTPPRLGYLDYSFSPGLN
jgi:hypothetical protein